MIRGTYKIKLIVKVDGSNASDALRKAQETAEYLENKNIFVSFGSFDQNEIKYYTVKFTEVPELKIDTIKQVRAILGIPLKEAKDFVEGTTSVRVEPLEFERLNTMAKLAGLSIEGTPVYE